MNDKVNVEESQAILPCAVASMMATTMYLWFRAFAVKSKYQSALLISATVIFVAAYHHFRILNSLGGSLQYTEGPITNGVMVATGPTLSGVLFNDACRYMDWLLTVPVLLVETLLVMNLSPQECARKSWTLGVAAVLMIVPGYNGELTVTGDLTPRWVCWFVSIVFFGYIVFEPLIGLSAARIKRVTQ